ncbi:MAG: HD domain-containing protein [Oscillospiraceae bacterium]|nr:HD domain-containing protein [Oscillospiraceae bacterium]
MNRIKTCEVLGNLNINTYEYINVPEITGNMEIDVKNLLELNGKGDTYKHVKAVADTNVQIAKMYGLDETNCKVSGFLHDISVVIQPKDMLNYFVNGMLFIDESEKRYPFLLHQRVSKLLSESLFKIFDPNILSSIECHTTLKDNPSESDMALFIADKLSWDQDGKPPFYDIVKKELSVSLEKASYAYINYIIDNNIILYPHQWLLQAKQYFEKFIL